MTYRMMLKFATIPSIIGSLLTLGMMVDIGSAANVQERASTLSSSPTSCDLPLGFIPKTSIILHQNQGVLLAASTIAGEVPILDFSEAESDAAVALFKCDCPACMNSLRQLRSQSSLNSGSGHCWTALLRVSPEKVKTVLQTLEAQEKNQ